MMHDPRQRSGRSRSQVHRVAALIALAFACSGANPAEPEEEEGEVSLECRATSSAGTPYGAGVNCRTVLVDGYPREYIVYVPAGYTFTADMPAPVVYMYHGSGGDGERFLRISGWREMADEVGLIAVFPTGLEYFVLEDRRWSTKWNEFNLRNEVALDRRPAGYPSAAPWPADDVAFARAIADDLIALLAIDIARMYVSGFSNGATFMSRLAVEATDRFAAFAWVGGGFCQPVQPVWTGGAPPRSMFMVIGAADTKLLGDSIPLGVDSLLAFPGLDTCLRSQVEAYALDFDSYTARQLPNITNVTWETPAATDYLSAFHFATLAGVEHVYPNGRNNPHGFAVAPRFWEFFEQHPMREHLR